MFKRALLLSLVAASLCGACSTKDGSASANLEDAACCDPASKPTGGIEGSHCCADGSWHGDIGNGSASSACGSVGVGEVCAEPSCCDPASKPTGGIEGSHCCADGSWHGDIGDGSASSACGSVGIGEVCSVVDEEAEAHCNSARQADPTCVNDAAYDECLACYEECAADCKPRESCPVQFSCD